jgi:hypothetical protein
MTGDFEQESRLWSAEVKGVAAELVRRGTPPYQAIEDAREIVSERRRRQATEPREGAR